MTNKHTKKSRILAWFFTILSLLLNFGPLIIYSVIAFKNSQASTANKCILLSMLTLATILSLVAVLKKYTPRCSIWLVVIGLYLCLDYILGTVLIIAVTQVLGELIIDPLARNYRLNLKINKQIDKRY